MSEKSISKISFAPMEVLENPRWEPTLPDSMNELSYPQTVCLSDLIDMGYSKCFAIQLDHAYDMDDSDFCLFETSDREEWGSTLMTAAADVLRTEDGRLLPGYVSKWLSPHYRLICVGTVDPVNALTVDQQDQLLDATLGRVLRMISQNGDGS